MKAMVVPLPADNVEAWKAWMRECQGPRRDEFDDFNERMGLTLHRAWLTQGAEGPAVIVVLDGPGAEDFLQKMTTSQEPFDEWFRDNVRALHEVDLAQMSAAPAAELLMDWRAPSYVEFGQ
jgi:hypothetical protein